MSQLMSQRSQAVSHCPVLDSNKNCHAMWITISSGWHSSCLSLGQGDGYFSMQIKLLGAVLNEPFDDFQVFFGEFHGAGENN